MKSAPSFLSIVDANENNLRSLSLAIPRNCLVAVTGVSGSGKSSLVFDVIYREAESRYLGSFSSYARQFLGRMKRPEVEKIDGLLPALAIDQRSVAPNPRSTVGTITEIHDYLRLLFARVGETETAPPAFRVERSLFSFNTPAGACPACKGLGVEDRLDPDLLIADSSKSLRQGCMKITAPNGYIIYSQVTIDVLDEVCRAEGFSVDIPWKDLTPEQKQVVFFGSDRIEIPFGKHTLSSRMRWSGITAKPRETGYYKGILPVMETILRQKRNRNILRFVRTTSCSACRGTRFNPNALSVTVHGLSIADLSALPLDKLRQMLRAIPFDAREIQIAEPIVRKIAARIDLLERLGLGYLCMNRASTTLSIGEGRRLQLAVLASAGLSDVLYILDEPSVGLHARDTERLIEVLKGLCDQGNSVIVVEHEEEFVRQADWLVELGPAAGTDGGRVILNQAVSDLATMPTEEIRRSRTLSFMAGLEKISVPERRRAGNTSLSIRGATENNLKAIDVRVKLEAFNVVTGVSGAGKSTLTNRVLGDFLRARIHHAACKPGACTGIEGWEPIAKIISIDQAPIGRTPRSNPATYTGLFDLIRGLFAAQPESMARGWKPGKFSFNTTGGRCETCQGAGFQQVGMHFMGTVEVPCEECNGRRFHRDTLEITFQGKDIGQILDLRVSEARAVFFAESRIMRYLDTLERLGLGYLTLGQRSSTLSGGEAQRIKLATELARLQAAHTLYILDEPTTGLHQADVAVLLGALDALVDEKHTVIVIEHHAGMIAAADWVIDLGPESGERGGFVVAEGTPEEIAACGDSHTGRALKQYLDRQRQGATALAMRSLRGAEPGAAADDDGGRAPLCFTGVSTHNLRHIDVVIPRGQITVITGVSGSGKSSLAFDTVFAEGQTRFLEGFSTYARTQIGIKDRPDFETASGLTPTLGIDQSAITAGPRSTVGTITGIYDLYRLLFARAALSRTGERAAISSLFSFNHQAGACGACRGLGAITTADPERLITDPGKSILAGAMDGTKSGRFYGDPFGQTMATLQAAGVRHNIDFAKPWSDLEDAGRRLALAGSGDDEYQVVWNYRRGGRAGEHRFQGTWAGIVNLVNAEYERKHADHRGRSMLPLMKSISCPGCAGGRLKRESLGFLIAGRNIAEVSALSGPAARAFFRVPAPDPVSAPLIQEIQRRLECLAELGLDYLSMDRTSGSLSGGEAQRVRLATQLGAGLTGITYVLDEPTIGLHGVDISRLMKTIYRLREAGNTVVLVEHDRDVISAADHLIDLGPGAGREGGRIVAQGTPAELRQNHTSITGRYLAQPQKITSRNRPLGAGLKIQAANANNLKNLTVEIPAQGIIAVTGVSGSGKSSLVFDVIGESWEKQKACGCAAISGLEQFRCTVAVESRNRLMSAHSTPATFTGMWDRIRNLFAKTADAGLLRLHNKHLSFFGKEGRCDACQGQGRITVSMDFLPDVQILCEKCKGARFRDEVLRCRYRGKNVVEVLAMTTDEAAGFFETPKELVAELEMLGKVGLGYLQLGQSLPTLSGGEAQRLTLAAELMKPASGRVLYLFDEPATGLHFRDIEFLLGLFHQLADQGHTLLMIEHDPQMILSADWVIDLGPEGGAGGGQLMAAGRINDVIGKEHSVTGTWLRGRNFRD